MNGRTISYQPDP